MGNAKLIRDTLSSAGYTVYGGVNAPYIWLKTPEGISSWDFFDLLLNKAYVVCTPVRLTAFGQPESVKEALERITAIS